MKGLRVVVALFMVALLAGACAKAPQQAIDAAKAALEEAKAAEANRYAPQEFAAANDTLNAALAEVEKQNGKFALFRSYKKAARMLAQAQTLANAAKDAAVANKEKVKNEATQLLQSAAEAVANVEKLLAKAPRGKEGREAIAAIKADLDAVKANLDAANTAFTNGDYLTARDKAQASLSKANSLAEELQAAISKKAALTRRAQ